MKTIPIIVFALLALFAGSANASMTITGPAGTISGNFSSSSPVTVNFANEQTVIYLNNTRLTLPVPITIYAANVTNKAPAPPQNYVVLRALELTIITNASFSTNVSMIYPCNISTSNLAPFIYENNTWNLTSEYSIDPAGCEIMFTPNRISSNTIVGLLLKTAATTSVTTTITHTILTTLPTTVASQPLSNYTRTETAAVVIIIVIIIIVVVVYALKKKH